MFFENTNPNIQSLKLIDTIQNKIYNFSQIEKIIDNILNTINSPKKSLVFLICDNSVLSVISYLAILRAGYTVLLLNYVTESLLLDNLISVYQPEYIISSKELALELNNYTIINIIEENLKIFASTKINLSEIFPQTAVLLSTSGTTGSPKLVRLSYSNIHSNAESIVKYLDIDSSEIAITSLPINYSYGLSVINSHILCGATIVCSNESITQKGFWKAFKDNNCTSLAGVPYNYHIFEMLKFQQMELPALKYMTQAGGKLAKDKVELFMNISQKKNFRFYVMYGQTEATARMTFIPPDMLPLKTGSVGIPIPGGKIIIMEDGIELKAGIVGEVIYTGPNVMLGYAETLKDLESSDEMHGILYTGDIGYLDKDGYLYITGRKKRFIKIVGQRINLDEAEKAIENLINKQIAIPVSDDILNVVVEAKDISVKDKIIEFVRSVYNLHHSLVNIIEINNLPLTTSGKKDYVAIKKMIINDAG